MRMSGGGGSSLQKSRGKKEAIGEACIIPWGNSAILGSGCGREVGMGEAEVPGEAAMGSKCMTPRSSVIPWDLCFRKLFVAD